MQTHTWSPQSVDVYCYVDLGTNSVPYILESNPHPFYGFRGLKNQMRIRIAVVSWILEKTIELLFVPKEQYNTIIYYFIYYL